MTRDETMAIMGVLKTAYPSYMRGVDGVDLDNTIELWAEMFDDAPASVVAVAVKQLIKTCKFPPTIADVLEKVRVLTEPPRMSEMAAWVMVSKAVANSIYNAEREFARLPEDVQGIVGNADTLRSWAMIDLDEFHTVLQSNFMRSYRAAVRYNADANRPLAGIGGAMGLRALDIVKDEEPEAAS